MKVALLIDTWFPQIGGGQTNAYEISKILAREGVRIDILTRNTGSENLELPKNLKVIKLTGKANPSNLISKIIFLIKAYYFVSKNQYDIVHSHAFLPGITARAINMTKGIPSVFTVHGTSLGTNMNNPLKRYLEKFILTQIIYSSQITVSQDFKKIKNKNKKIFYIPNGIDIKKFGQVPAFKEKTKTLISVGRLHPQKNLLNLIEAIKVLKTKIPTIKLLIVGDGIQRGLLKNRVLESNLEGNIFFKGEVKNDKLIRLLKSADLFVLPSIYEGQSIALLEAWASRIPVLTTKTGDSPYLVKDGQNGFLIKSPNSKDIASAIEKALKSKRLHKMGANGYNLVAKNFSWEKSAQMTLRVYESLTKT